MGLNEDIITKRNVFDAGLELIKADFHLHTQKDKEFSYTGEQNDFVKCYVAALKQKHIGILWIERKSQSCDDQRIYTISV